MADLSEASAVLNAERMTYAVRHHQTRQNQAPRMLPTSARTVEDTTEGVDTLPEAMPVSVPLPEAPPAERSTTRVRTAILSGLNSSESLYHLFSEEERKRLREAMTNTTLDRYIYTRPGSCIASSVAVAMLIGMGVGLLVGSASSSPSSSSAHRGTPPPSATCARTVEKLLHYA